MPQGEEGPDGNRALALLHQFAGDVIDGGDVVGIHRMAESVTVSQQRGGNQCRVMMKGSKGRPPRQQV
ncbi:hypothetical protein D3C76_1663860 [compost metagenome]